MNYRKHAIELGKAIPTEPVVFLKPDSALLKNNKPFFLPDFSSMIHYETELVAKIGKLGKGIEPEYALRYIDEVTLGIDITARDIQNKNAAAGLPWELSKGFDGSAPIGKFLPVESLGNLNDLKFHLEINGKTVQEGHTSDMIFNISELISYISKFFTLKTGDLLFTGTPVGVGPMKKGDNLVAYLGDKVLLDFMIR